MCGRKPEPRCYSHAQEAVDRLEQGDCAPLVGLNDVELLAASRTGRSHGAPVNKWRAKALVAARLDRDATKEGIRRLTAEHKANPTDLVTRYRLAAAQACLASKVELGKVHRDIDTVDNDTDQLTEYRENLARTEGITAGLLTVRGTLQQGELNDLVNAYEATLTADAQVRLNAAGHKPNMDHTDARTLTRWTQLDQTVADVAPTARAGAQQAADEVALATHKDAARATWAYPHAIPAGGHRTDFHPAALNALEAVRVAALTRTPITFDGLAVQVASTDDRVRQRLWRAGYHTSSPVGPIVVRPAARRV